MKAVIFDLDGTITELTLPLDAMRNDTKGFFIGKGYPADLFDVTDGISSSRQKARDYFCSNGLSKSEWDKLESELDKILSAHENWAATDADGSSALRQSVYAQIAFLHPGVFLCRKLRGVVGACIKAQPATVLSQACFPIHRYDAVRFAFGYSIGRACFHAGGVQAVVTEGRQKSDE